MNSVKIMDGKMETCMNCAWETSKGRVCPITIRLHEPSPNKKLWFLNRTNFGCILFDPKGIETKGKSVLDKLDRREMVTNNKTTT